MSQVLSHSPSSIHSNSQLPGYTPAVITTTQPTTAAQPASVSLPSTTVNAGPTTTPQRASTVGGPSQSSTTTIPLAIPQASSAVTSQPIPTPAPRQPAATLPGAISALPTVKPSLMRHTTGQTNSSSRQNSLNSVTGASVRQVLNQSANLPPRSTGQHPIFVQIKRAGTFPLDSSSSSRQ
jgi:hypothetical protein